MTVGLLPTTPQHDFQHHNKPFHGDYVEGSNFLLKEIVIYVNERL